MEPRQRPFKFSDFIDPKKFDVIVRSSEAGPELEARLQREAEDAAHERDRKRAIEEHERRKDFLLFVASLSIVAISALACLVSLFVSPTNPWASPLLTLIVGGLLGYRTGKAQGTKSGP